MKVLVTGGTGFLGGHVIARLVGAGHDVRLLVRRREQVPLTLRPFGVTVDDLHSIVVGDVTDREAVGRSLEGAEAVVHAAAVFSSDRRRQAEIARTNVRATELVLGGAASRGLDPIIHVSSTAALTRKAGTDPSLPLGDLDLAYARSKIDSERIARALAAECVPVVTLNPGAIAGPYDPYLGETNEFLRWILRGRLPVFPKGAMQFVDVRDVAATALACLEPGQGPRQYVVPGHHVGAAEIFGACARAVGARRPYVRLPGPMVVPFSQVMSRLQAVLPTAWRTPTDMEGISYLVYENRFDDTPARTDLGVIPRSFDETVADTAVWLADAGLLGRRTAAKVRNVTGR